MEDRKQFDLYNWALFDADSSLYAQLLPGEHYEIPDYTVTIPAGERTGKTMVRINPERLSPDSTYFIALKLKRNPDYEIHPDTNTLLYQVLLKNDYASQAEDDLYSICALFYSPVTAGHKRMFPLTQHKVRLLAGN